ncbi:pyridoxal phosphate-dependent decarboxylase family protein [Winogradskya humida]|uniref:Aspartate aminotransferase family protein n=1 Tax=Winogradskya humida TaxID=113566 RepID=A0ABQ4A3T6_9ACTN|nr:pyridoxal-dependent decarboxylase [Actinoplanes humidus]GIE25515.1 aspartate aminotransferase family protein [Actinoplanes humidus]
MDPILAGDLARFPDLLTAVRDQAVKVLASLDDRPVALPGEPPSPETLPQQGAGLDGALDRFAERWQDRMSGSAGPRYLGFVTGGATPAAVAGDWLTSALDQNLSSGAGSAAPDLERETVRWLRDLFGLPGTFSGSFVTGATMSNFVGLALGRQWYGEQYGADAAEDGLRNVPPLRVLSGTPHSSIVKATSMLGVGRNQVRVLPTLPGREAVDLAALEAALAEGPAIVVANAGTVNTVDFDDLRAIADLRQRYPFWLHVDGAFGLFAALSREHAPLLDGLDEADSVCADLHKWLNVPYDAAVQFTRRPDLQVAVFRNAAAYLGDPGENPDFMHLTPENSRRFRALPAWFALTAYGANGHREIVERNTAAARRLGELLGTVPGVRLLAPVRMNVVCFAIEGDVPAALRAVTATGRTFLTPTVYDGQPGIRAAFSNWRTTVQDAEEIFETLRHTL